MTKLERKLLRENSRLRRALKPFAREAATWANFVGNSFRPGVCEPRNKYSSAKAEFSIGDLRRAARLVNHSPLLAPPPPADTDNALS
jgi:hypothetical protein